MSSHSREEIRRACRADEAARVAALANELAAFDYDRKAVSESARRLVGVVRMHDVLRS